MMSDRPQHGSRPVSLDLARTGVLSQLVPPRPEPVALPSNDSPAIARRRSELVAQLMERAWPAGQRFVVCSTDGGVGRTAVASALAVLSAKYRSAPTLYVDLSPALFTATARRLGLPATATARAAVEKAGAWPDHARGLKVCGTGPSGVLGLMGATADSVAVDQQTLVQLVDWLGSSSGQVVLDVPGIGLGPWDRPGAVVVVVCRGDEDSLRRHHDLLVWLRDRRGVATKERLVVVVNHLAGTERSRAGRSLATALETRCSGVVHLSADKALSAEARPLTADRLSKANASAFVKVLLAVTKGTSTNER